MFFSFYQLLRPFLLLAFFICICFTSSAQKNITLSGFVQDEATGESLIGATLYDTVSKRAVATNEYGYFCLSLPLGKPIYLKVSFIGYTTYAYSAVADKSKQLSFKLKQGVELQEVFVLAEQPSSKRNEIGTMRIQTKEVKMMPAMFGEVDVIKALQMTPGVQSGGEGKNNLYVRGGSPDQNLILLDDVPLYYAGHFGGFLSVFNVDALNDVKLYKGSFSAKYGGRLSSVLDVRMKEGNAKKFGMKGMLGLVSSKVSAEGPIAKDKVSYIASLRGSTLPGVKMFTEYGFKFYDFNAKVNYRLNENTRFFLSTYMGDDVLTLDYKGDDTKEKRRITWGNSLWALRWNQVYSPKLFSNLTVARSRYRYLEDFSFMQKKSGNNKKLSSSLYSGIADLIVKTDFTWNTSPFVKFYWGGQTIMHHFRPNDERYNQSGDKIDDVNAGFESLTKATESALYLENEIKTKYINVVFGGRLVSFNDNESTFYSLEPRCLVNLQLGNTFAVKGAYTQMQQYIHLLSYSGAGVPSDYWVPATEQAQPERSEQISVSVVKDIVSGKFEFSFGAYTKTQQNQVAFVRGRTLSGTFDEWETVAGTGGTSENYGVELFFKKKSGKTTGWISSTVSKAERTFENLNNGEPFPYKYDRPLAISIVANHQFSKQFTISATWNYGTGYPVTLAEERYKVGTLYSSAPKEDVFVFNGVNNRRMSDYHRLDLAANFTKKTSWGERTIAISILNAYANKNPYYYYYREKFETDEHGGVVYAEDQQEVISEEDDGINPIEIWQQTLFSFFPSISYSFSF